ncbi:MAG TPA: DMT family transporter [Usitatibacter sp.]|nr:DMT family transporter [Usitatibacter sp.]
MTSSWMLVAGFFFAAMGVFVKFGAESFDAAELAFYRSFLGLVFIAGLALARKWPLRTPHLGGHVIRSVVGSVSLIGYFYAMSRLPLATAQTLNYTSPIFLAVALVVVLGEKFSWWLVAAIAVGFAGVALLLHPTMEAGKESPALIGLFSGVFAAWAYLSVRTLGKLGEPDYRVVFWFTLIGSILCAGWQLATSTFHALRPGNAWTLVGLGFCGTVAQLAMTRAYRTGNTLVVGAFSYSTLVFGAAATYIVWNERLPPAELAGIAVIIASGLMAMRVEKKEAIEEAGFES